MWTYIGTRRRIQKRRSKACLEDVNTSKIFSGIKSMDDAKLRDTFTLVFSSLLNSIVHIYI